MGVDLVFHSEAVGELWVSTGQPLLGVDVLYQEGLLGLHGGVGSLETLRGVDVLETPDTLGQALGLSHRHFLFLSDLGLSSGGGLGAVESEWLVG